MTFPTPLPWLAYNGVEVANAARTMAYIRSKKPQASGVFELPSVFPCGVLYREIGGGAFGRPETDPAPWYHASIPESGAFLGFVPATMYGLDSVINRIVTPRLGGIEGGQLGLQHLAPRDITVQGHLIATTVAGNEYGLRWLTEQLSAPDCDLCQSGPLNVRTSCPPDDGSNDAQGRYTLYDVGLTVGPHDAQETAGTPATICDIREVTFTLTAQNPYLYQQPVTCQPAVTIGATHNCAAPSPGICNWLFGTSLDAARICNLAAPPLGTLGVIVTLGSVDGMGGVTIGLYPGQYNGLFIPPPSAALALIQVDSVPANSNLIVDSAQRKITLVGPDPKTGVIVGTDGTDLIDLPEGTPLKWLELATCDGPTAFVAVQTTHPCSGGAQTSATIQTQTREK